MWMQLHPKFHPSGEGNNTLRTLSLECNPIEEEGVHIYLCRHIHARTLALTHARTHALGHTHTHTYTRTHMRAQTHTKTHIHARTQRTRTLKHASRTQNFTPVCTHKHKLKRTHPSTSSPPPPSPHTHVHTFTHAYTQDAGLFSQLLRLMEACKLSL